jgi:tRNA pseudouridine55 synthase
VRALIRDLGERLGCLGHVVALRRLACGPFRAEAAISLAALEQLVADDALPQALMPVSVALCELPALALTEPQAHRLCAGQTIRIAPGLIMGEAGDDATVRAMTAGQVVALARLQGVELSPLRVFHL